jgi:thiamine pyrophosphate-dependent acetolactate synthase large subunit-like protein
MHLDQEDSTVDRKTDNADVYGSDVIANAIRQTSVPYIALTPGASFRGLHDSIVNHLGDHDPKILMCLHEEHAVAIAHGYAKVTGEPLAVALHSNVGLLHAAMAVFNAYADRVPMLVVGADGPSDAAKRRPWIDWLHTVSDLGAIVRNFVKWDDRAESASAAVPMLLRGDQLTRTAPTAPVFVALDTTAQEGVLKTAPPDVRPLVPIPAPRADGDSIDQAREALQDASRVVILAGRVSRSQEAWDQRVALAEALGARVITNHRQGAAFPTTHPLHAGTPVRFLDSERQKLLAEADCILSLDWVDLGGTLEQVFGDGPHEAKIVHASLEHNLLSGGGKLHYAVPRVDIHLTCTSDEAVRALLPLLSGHSPHAEYALQELAPPAPAIAEASALTTTDIQVSLFEAVRGDAVTLTRVAFGWDFSYWPLSGPLDYLGADGGGGIGSGPGMSVGSALALRASNRLPIAILGDGDFLMGVTALWTASRYDIPLLVIVANNLSFFNDEAHQREVADVRSRPAENAHVGIHIDEPAPDLAGFARAQGFAAIGPVSMSAWPPAMGRRPR